MADAIHTLSTYLRNNTDKKGTPLYDSALEKLKELSVAQEQPQPITQPVGKPQIGGFFKEDISVADVRGTRAVRFAEGAADLPIGITQFALNLVGKGKGINEFVQQREQGRREGREAAGVDTDIAGVAGTLLTGGVATRGLSIAKTLLGKVVQGVGLGAAFGAATPAEDFERKPEQILTGAVTGGVTPLAIRGAQAVATVAKPVIEKGAQITRNLVDPFLPGGTERALRRIVQETVDGNPQALAIALRESETTGQAAVRTVNPRLAAMVQSVQNRRAQSTVLIREARNASRRASLRSAAGANTTESIDEVIERTITSRQVQTQPLFVAARESKAVVDPTKPINLINRMIKADPKKKPLVSALNEVRDTLFIKTPAQTGRIALRDLGAPAVSQVKDTSARGLISASKNIGLLIAKTDPVTGKRINEQIVRELVLVKKSLDSAIARSVPEYKVANTLFQELSLPVNRAQIAKRLENALVSPVEGKTIDDILVQRGTAFANAIRDERALIGKATGFKRGKDLESIFGKEELGKILSISQNIKDDATLVKIANEGRAGLARITQQERGETFINPLQRVIMVINGIIKRTGVLRLEKALDKGSEVFEDRLLLAKLLESATPGEIQVMKRSLASDEVSRFIRVAPAILATQE